MDIRNRWFVGVRGGGMLGASVVAAVLLGCSTSQSPKESHTEPAPVAPGPAVFGAPIQGGQSVALGKVFAEPDAFATKSVIVEGVVRAACRRKGCWMELAPNSDAGAPGCRVTFKDYGFFVPTDSAGAFARVQGAVAVRTVAAADVAHLESEGAHFAKKLSDGSAQEVQIIATGVELTRP